MDVTGGIGSPSQLRACIIAATRSMGGGDTAIIRRNASQRPRNRTSVNAVITVEADAEMRANAATITLV